MNEKKIEIAVDVDGVLLDTMITFCEIYNEVYSGSKGFKSKSKEDVTSWQFNHDWNLPDTALWHIFDLIAEQLLFVPFVDPHASVVMRKLRRKFIVDIVTARKEKDKGELVAKLHKHRIMEGVNYDALHTVDRHDFNVKLDMCYNIYIDDNPNLVENIKQHEDKLLLLYDQPWNQNCICSDNVIRVKNWREVWKVIMLVNKQVNTIKNRLMSEV